MNKEKNKRDAQQVLIDNLKKQLLEKRESYADMRYRAAILQVVNDKTKENDKLSSVI